MLMRPDSLLEWVKPPQQERSQRTLERLLDAAEAIILEQGAEAMSVSAVAKRAHSSVGAFYARFEDRDALLRAVCERFAVQARATMEAVLEPTRWEDETLESVLNTGLRFVLRVVNERRPLLASLSLAALRDVEIGRTLNELVAHLSGCFATFLAARDELPRSAQSELTVSVLSGVLLSLLQAQAMRHPSLGPPISEALLADELTRLCLAYLAPQKS